jgi:DNA-binding NtrC family response regulator
MDDTTLQVVVVDDEPQITELLSTYIQSLPGNHLVHAFNDPEEARAYLLQHGQIADVLVTDLKMPKFDGIQLMNLVPGNALKILISGYVSELIEDNLRSTNAVFLEKPVSLKQLGALIGKAAAGRAGRPCVR